MAYSALTDILDQMEERILIQLTDDAKLGAVNQDVVAEAIADADAEIDSYCGNRYDVPLATATAMIAKISRDIAMYNLYGRRPNGPSETVKERYANAVRFLKDVSAGRVSLGANAPETSSGGGPASTTSREDRIFTRDTLRNF